MTARRRRAKKIDPYLMRMERGGGVYLDQKKIGRCFRFEKILVPYAREAVAVTARAREKRHFARIVLWSSKNFICHT